MRTCCFSFVTSDSKRSLWVLLVEQKKQSEDITLGSEYIVMRIFHSFWTKQFIELTMKIIVKPCSDQRFTQIKLKLNYLQCAGFFCILLFGYNL